MIVAVVGSRDLTGVDIAPFISAGTETIISGGARGIGRIAADYARKNGIRLVEIKPDYQRHGKGAPLRRNDEIVDRAELVIAFWNGHSKGTEYVINRCRKVGKPCRIVFC